MILVAMLKTEDSTLNFVLGSVTRSGVDWFGEVVTV